MAPVIYAAVKNTADLNRPTFMPGYIKREINYRPVTFSPVGEREIIIHGSEASKSTSLLLIDTPDFDSVLEANRAAALDVFLRADAIIFVTDAVKYADQVSWDYLNLLAAHNKEAVLVVNRIRTSMSLMDFKSRVEKAGLDRPVLSLPDDPGLKDMEPFDPENRTIGELKKTIAAWSGPARPGLLAREAARTWEELEDGLNKKLLPALNQALLSQVRLKEILEQTESRLQAELPSSLAVTISGELKSSLIVQIQTLFLRWDPLKYPRRLMAIPFNYFSEKVLSPLGIKTGAMGGRKVLDREIDRLFAANLDKLLAALNRFNQSVNEQFKADTVGRGLAAGAGFAKLALEKTEVEQKYVQVRRELETWIQEQANELVKGLDPSEKVTFYLAQGVSMGLLISIQVHTGGGFSFFDGLLDSAMAPLMSKIAGSALSKEKVKAFETEAAHIHLKKCGRIITDQARAYLDYVAEAEKGLSAAKPLAAALRELQGSFEGLF